MAASVCKIFVNVAGGRGAKYVPIVRIERTERIVCNGAIDSNSPLDVAETEKIQRHPMLVLLSRFFAAGDRLYSSLT